ncbi:regulatory protein, arsR family [Paraburkholderia phenazinium]|uniref:Regulatory protein, arsR family n=1 Tax=Paraburkholderia phenazinium TaxID=60549 RepID=A0A1G7ZPJ6_9BURK|nr:ArsR family transcriptional regulator [Paraburkholderia phenazinium]SDH10497.1 regulatory protein, arsR family [Paraburkholderia phenazinium]
MRNAWTPEEEEILSKAWLGTENFKRQLIQIPRHSYHAAVSHARDVMGLGPRAHSDRGAAGFAWNLVKAEIERLPSTVSDITRRTGLSQSVIDRHLRASNPGPDGKTHVIGWRQGGGGRAAAIYAIGPGKNVPRPPRQSQSEKVRLYGIRRRLRKTGATMVNPFAPALGLVQVPTAANGRVVHNLWDEPEEIAA